MELGVFSIVNMERHGKTNAVRSLYSPILQTERLFFFADFSGSRIRDSITFLDFAWQMSASHDRTM